MNEWSRPQAFHSLIWASKNRMLSILFETKTIMATVEVLWSDGCWHQVCESFGGCMYVCVCMYICVWEFRSLFPRCMDHEKQYKGRVWFLQHTLFSGPDITLHRPDSLGFIARVGEMIVLSSYWRHLLRPLFLTLSLSLSFSEWNSLPFSLPFCLLANYSLLPSILIMYVLAGK